MLQDLRLALRLLRSKPGFSLAAILPLAAAIACVTAVLTLVSAVLFRPMGVRDPANLVSVYAYSTAKSNYLSGSFPEFKDVESLRGIVLSAAAFVRIPLAADFGTGTELLPSELATGDYFRTAGIAPVLGRAFGPDDDRSEAPPVLLLSYALWESRFQKSRSALGSTVRIGDARLTVIGVMPRGYVGTLLDWGAAPAFWVPLSQIARVSPPFAAIDYRNRREVRWLMTAARLKPGTSAAQLQAALDVVHARLAAVDPKLYTNTRFAVLASREARFFPGYRDTAIRSLSVLAAVAGAVLMIACFNLFNLLLARVAARRREIYTRLALGAPRARIFTQFLVESLLFASLALALGMPLSVWLARVLAGFRLILSASLNLNLSPDPRPLLWGAGACLAAGALVGVLAAVSAGRTDLRSGLGPTAHSRIGVRDFLVAAQVACAVVALISAALLAGSLRELRSARHGFDTGNTLLATLDLSGLKLGRAQSQKFCRTLLDRLRSDPVEGAALAAEPLPATTRWSREVAAVDSASPALEIEGNAVSDGFFELVRMPVEAGRGIGPGDTAQAPQVVVLNRTAANLLWPGANPVGRSLRISGEPAAREVVGVVSDADYHPLADRRIPYFFLPLAQSPRLQVTIYVRTPRGLEFAPVLRRSAGQLDGRAPLYGIRTLQEQVDSGFEQVRLAAVSTGAVGFAGALLALAGVFAMTAWRVVQDSHAIAIRMALGAVHGRVLVRTILRNSTVGAAGVGAGVLLAAWTTPLLRAAVRGVGAAVPGLYLLSAAVVLVFVVIAALLPARQILRVDPAALLRAE